MTDEQKHYKAIPKQVRVGCFTFKIIVGTYEDHEQESTYGHYNPHQMRISIRPGLCADRLRNVFLHEVLHAIHQMYGLINHEDESVNPTEEQYTTLTANGLCAFWQDNPRAVAWWAGLGSKGCST